MFTEVLGFCDPRFRAVQDVFADSLAQGDDLGGAVAVACDGQLVVDIWGGFADQAGTAPWQAATLVNVFSATKGALAVALGELVDDDLIDLDQPVGRYWPGFAQGGKEDVSVRSLLDHTAGLAAFSRPMSVGDVLDWDTCVQALEAQEPLWDPEQGHGYHALTFGWLVGELIRRIGRRTPATLLGDTIRTITAGELRIGLTPAEQGGVAEIGPIPVDDEMLARLRSAGGSEPSLTAAVFGNPPLLRAGLMNSPEWRGAVVPAANGHATARGLARLYGALGLPGGLLKPQTVRRCAEGSEPRTDLVLGVETAFSLGFMLDVPYASESSFGHPGAGGSLGYHDPVAGVGFGYVTNRPEATFHVGQRATRLLAALYDCFGADPNPPIAATASRSRP